MKKAGLTGWLVLWLFHLLQAQPGTQVTGVVRDRVTQKPLPGASVFVSGARGVMSDSAGAYRLSLPSGTYALQARFVGYRPHQETIHLSEGEDLTCNILMEPSAEMLNEVVVSAEKFEQKISEVTVSMSVIKPERITLSDARSLDEVLNQVPGIQILDGQPGIRGGSGYSYGAGSRVLVVLDGLPLMSGDAGDVKWSFLPMDNLSQVEIIKGASSVLYGSSALNGVINLRTREPGVDPQTSLRIFAGDYLRPSRKELVWYSTPRWYAGASLNDARKVGAFDIVSGLDLYDNTGYRQDEYEKKASINLHLRYHPEQWQGWTLGMNMRTMAIHSSDFFLWQNADEGAYLQNPAGTAPLRGIRLTLDPYVTYHSESGGMHTLRTRFFTNSNHMPENPDKDNRFHLMLGEYRYSKLLAPWLRLTAGITENYSRVHASLYGDHTRNEMAFYSQANISSNKVKTSLGIRWENYTLDQQWTAASPVARAGINYALFPATHLRVSVGQGYRFPSIAEKYTATQVGALNIFPNPDLVPESGWSAEAGIMQGFRLGNWKGSFDLAVYRNEYRQMIEFMFGMYLPDSVNVPSLEYVGFKALNTGKARITGTELLLNLSGNIGRVSLRLQGGYNYDNPIDLNIPASDTTNRILKYRFRHTLKGNLVLSCGRVLASTTVVYNSFMERVDDVFTDPLFGNTILPGYPDYRATHHTGHTVTDVHLGYTLSTRLQLSATVKNLFNVEYMGRPGDIRPQRSITLQAQFSW